MRPTGELPRMSRLPTPAVLGLALLALLVVAASPLVPAPFATGGQAAYPQATAEPSVTAAAPISASAVAAGTTPSPSLSPRPSPSAKPSVRPSPRQSPSATGLTLMENRVTELVNVERRKAGCGALRTDERIRKAARAHSADMVRYNFFSHTGHDGSSFVDRMIRAGYPRYDAAAENIAYGYATAAAVVQGWMNSDGHRRNILNCANRAVGVGLVYRGSTPYWTQDFGRS